MTAPAWLVLAWRLPSGPSTPRVTLWRSLRALGAVGLTPGAAVLPYQEDLVEQLDWLAESVEEAGGDAWVLPVVALRAADERRIRAQMQADRSEEYSVLVQEATAWLRRRQTRRGAASTAGSSRDREVVAMQRRLNKVRKRDFFQASGLREAARLVDRCLAVSRGLGQGSPRAHAAEGGTGRELHHARAGSR